VFIMNCITCFFYMGDGCPLFLEDLEEKGLFMDTKFGLIPVDPSKIELFCNHRRGFYGVDAGVAMQ